jgi:hypothetical protein
MTRSEILDKIAKLRRLARNNTCEQEAASARRKADDLAARHGVSEDELTNNKTSAAHDELVEELRIFAARKMKDGGALSLFGAAGVIDGVLQEIKKAGNEDKSARLRKLVEVARTASLLSPSNFRPLREMVEKVLKNHDVTL